MLSSSSVLSLELVEQVYESLHEKLVVPVDIFIRGGGNEREVNSHTNNTREIEVIMREEGPTLPNEPNRGDVVRVKVEG